jgi:hypothetical protein
MRELLARILLFVAALAACCAALLLGIQAWRTSCPVVGRSCCGLLPGIFSRWSAGNLRHSSQAAISKNLAKLDTRGRWRACCGDATWWRNAPLGNIRCASHSDAQRLLQVGIPGRGP